MGTYGSHMPSLTVVGSTKGGTTTRITHYYIQIQVESCKNPIQITFV